MSWWELIMIILLAAVGIQLVDVRKKLDALLREFQTLNGKPRENTK